MLRWADHPTPPFFHLLCAVGGGGGVGREKEKGRKKGGGRRKVVSESNTAIRAWVDGGGGWGGWGGVGEVKRKQCYQVSDRSICQKKFRQKYARRSLSITVAKFCMSSNIF